MTSELNIVVSEEKARVVVTIFQIKGEITADSCTLLETKTYEAIDGGARHLMLDLRGVTFMSSSGLRTIHAVYKKLQEVNHEFDEQGKSKSKYLKLLNVPEKIFKGIRLIGLDTHLETLSDREYALASF